MHPNQIKNDFLYRFKEDENDIEELSRIEESELLQSPKFKRLQSSSPPRSSSSSPLKANISKINANSSFENKPDLQFTPKENIPKTPTKSGSRHQRRRVDSGKGILPPKFTFNSPTKLHHDAKITNAKVSLTPAQRFEKKPGKLFSTKDILSSYEFKETVGRGAFANVYRAINKITGDEVAIKEIFIEDDDDILELMCEIDLLKILKHKNIVKYHGFIKNDKKLLIFLEYCSGGSLRNVYKKKGPLTEKQVVKYMKQVLEGLIYLHGQGVVHRDVKAANILLTSKGDIKLTDFGVSTKVSNNTIKTYSIAGTPNWMAPEIISMDGTSTASDIWSLGATIVELLTGEPLYSHLNEMAALHAIVTDDTPPIPTFISSACKDFLLKCFEKQPSQRVGAKDLLKHPWLAKSSRKSESTEEISFITSTIKSSRSGFKNDFNSIKRFNTRKFLPLDLNAFKHTEQDINSIIDDELAEDFESLALEESQFVVASSKSASLFEPMEVNEKVGVTMNMKNHLMENHYEINAAHEITKAIRDNELNMDVLLNQNFIFHILQWIETAEDDDELLIAYIDLVSSILEVKADAIPKIISFGGISTLSKLLVNNYSYTLRSNVANLFDVVFEKDQTYMGDFIVSGGLIVVFNLLQEDYKKCSNLLKFSVQFIKGALCNNSSVQETVQFMLFNYNNSLDWLSILLMESAKSHDNFTIDSIVEIISHLHVSKTSLVKPIFLNSIFKIHEKLSSNNQITILKFLKKLNLNEVPQNSNLLKFLVKTVHRILQQKTLKPEILNITCSLMFSCCHLNQEKQIELVRLHIFPLFQELINSTLPCTEFVIPLLCEFPFNHLLLPFISKQKSTLLGIFSELLIDPVWHANALDSLVALHERIGMDDSVAKYLLHDEYHFLLNGFLVENSLNSELYLERLIKLLNSYSNSLTVNQIRLSFFNNSEVIDSIFQKVSQHKSDLVVQINLFKLLKILSANNFEYKNFEKISFQLNKIKPTNVLLIDQLINEILEGELDKENSLMGPPTGTTPKKLVF